MIHYEPHDHYWDGRRRNGAARHPTNPPQTGNVQENRENLVQKKPEQNRAHIPQPDQKMSAIRQREKDLRARAAELGVKIPNEFQNWDYYYRSFDSFAEAFEEWLDNIQNGIVTAEPLIDFDREPTMSEKQQLREELRETQNNWRNKSGYQQGQQFRLENENVIGFRGYVSQPLTLARPAPSGTIGGQHVM